MRASSILRRIKNSLVADEIRNRRILAGIARGAVLPINLRHEFRLWLGMHEREIQSFFRQYVRPGSVCYDVGAAVGYYTMAFSRLASPGVVYSFEPDPQSFALLNRTISLNTFNCSDIKASPFFITDQVNESEQMYTLDSLVESGMCREPSFVKIDIEGCEFDALRGSRSLLEKCGSVWLVEVHSKELEDSCSEYLKSFRYTVRSIPRRTVFPEYRPAVYNSWIFGLAPDR
jgi:hypothetical protein